MIELDPEVKARVLEFVWDTKWVNHQRIVGKFFPDDPDTARLHLDQLKSDGAVKEVIGRYGQVVGWKPYAEPTSGPVIPVKWRQYLDGESHTVTAEEIREKYGITIPQFRRRLVFASLNYVGDLSSQVTGDSIQFRIENSQVSMRKRKRRKPMSHAYCGHPITRTDRLACQRAQRRREP